MSISLWPCIHWNTRLPRPSPSPGICSNSCLLSQWCHPTISRSPSPSVSPFFFHQSFLASGSFAISWLFTSRSQNFGALVWVRNIYFQIFFSFMGDSCFAAASNMCIECLMDITTKGVRQRPKKVQNMHSRELCSRFDSLGQEIGTLGKWMNFMTPLFSNT